MRQRTTADAPRRYRSAEKWTARNSTEMSQATLALAPSGTVRWMIFDSLVIFGRHLRKLLRTPDRLILSLARTTILVLLLAYVIGGTVQVPGGDFGMIRGQVAGQHR